MLQRPKTAVIILNYNSAAHTLRCVDSILKHTADLLDTALVVVDNASAKPDQAQLTALASDHVTLVHAEKNLGFAGGMMLGADAVDAEYYFFLKNDCEFRNDVVAVLSSFLDQHPQAALCSGYMLDSDGKPRSSFNYFPSLWLMLLGSGLLRLFSPSRYPDRRKPYAQPVPVDVVTGAAMFTRGTVLKQLGGLDTGFFLYCEEEDYALRIKQAGWKTWFVPQAHIMHIGGASSGDALLRPALQREFYISMLRYLRLHHNLVYATAFRLFIVLKLLRRAITGKVPFSLAVFVFKGAPGKESLRYKQPN
jgi:GT2 family glycosyltransferase